MQYGEDVGHNTANAVWSELLPLLTVANPSWTVKELNSAKNKLSAIGITTFSHLEEALQEKGRLNNLLRRNSLKVFGNHTLECLRRHVASEKERQRRAARLAERQRLDQERRENLGQSLRSCNMRSNACQMLLMNEMLVNQLPECDVESMPATLSNSGDAVGSVTIPSKAVPSTLLDPAETQGDQIVSTTDVPPTLDSVDSLEGHTIPIKTVLHLPTPMKSRARRRWSNKAVPFTRSESAGSLPGHNISNKAVPSTLLDFADSLEGHTISNKAVPSTLLDTADSPSLWLSDSDNADSLEGDTISNKEVDAVSGLADSETSCEVAATTIDGEMLTEAASCLSSDILDSDKVHCNVSKRRRSCNSWDWPLTRSQKNERIMLCYKREMEYLKTEIKQMGISVE